MLEEPHIPFEYEVLYEDENIIVIDKPHFLATTPRGMWYRETALVRLCERYDEPNITPAHRLDRLTAGVVVFVRNPSARGAYQMLFQNRKTVKAYECLAPLAPTQRPRYGTAVRIDRHLPFPLVRRSHINKDRGRLQAYESADVPNAETLIERGSGIRFVAGRPYVNYTLHPKTGKTHQLRVHMNSLGLAILGDDFYPDIVQRAYDDFSQPLELVARELRFPAQRRATSIRIARAVGRGLIETHDFGHSPISSDTPDYHGVLLTCRSVSGITRVRENHG